MIKAVVFDLDDTLYPEIDYVKSGFNAVAKYIDKNKSKNIFEELWTLFNISRQSVFDRFLDLNRRYKYSTEELHEVYINHKPKIVPYNDVEFIVNLLKEKYKLGLITDGRVIQQNNKIDGLNVRQYFDKILITDELGGVNFRKPNPISFEIMIKEFNILPEQMVYIGDNPKKDFHISLKYPITTIQILRKECLYDEDYLDDVKPQHIINTLNDILKIETILI